MTHPLDEFTIKVVLTVVPFWLISLWIQYRIRRAEEEF